MSMRTHPIALFALAFSGVCFGQEHGWIGKWTLDIKNSEIPPPMLRAAPGVTLLGQTLKIERTGAELKISAIWRMSDGRPREESAIIRTDERETKAGGGVTNLKSISNTRFEFAWWDSRRDFSEASTYEVSADGMSLTATKAETRILSLRVGSYPAGFSSTATLRYVRAAN